MGYEIQLGVVPPGISGSFVTHENLDLVAIGFTYGDRLTLKDLGLWEVHIFADLLATGSLQSTTTDTGGLNSVL